MKLSRECERVLLLNLFTFKLRLPVGLYPFKFLRKRRWLSTAAPSYITKELP